MDFGEVSLSLNPVNTKQCLCGHGSPHSKVLDARMAAWKMSCPVWGWEAGRGVELGCTWHSWPSPRGIAKGPLRDFTASCSPQNSQFVRKLCSHWANSVCDLSPGKWADHLCNTEILEGAGIALCFIDQCQDKWPRKANVL